MAPLYNLLKYCGPKCTTHFGFHNALKGLKLIYVSGTWNASYDAIDASNDA